MPDLKSELFKAMAHAKAKPKEESLDDLKFDDEESTPTSQPTDSPDGKLTNASLVAYVESHPACTFTEIQNAFHGYSSGVGARLKQLTDRDIFTRVKRDDVYHYTRSTKPFAPMTTEERIKLINAARAARGTAAKKPKKRKAAPKSITLVRTKKATTRPAAPAPEKAQWDVDTIISSLGLKQAKALYDELRKFFG